MPLLLILEIHWWPTGPHFAQPGGTLLALSLVTGLDDRRRQAQEELECRNQIREGDFLGHHTC